MGHSVLHPPVFGDTPRDTSGPKDSCRWLGSSQHSSLAIVEKTGPKGLDPLIGEVRAFGVNEFRAYSELAPDLVCSA